MTLRLFNTLTGKKEVFTPQRADKVGLYVCGITAYDSCHIGHARSAVVFDVIVRFLKSCRFDVTYVKNFTDIDDKIIDKASRLGISAREVADRFIAEHDREMERLGVSRPTHSPKATDHIAAMITMIRKLESSGTAYERDGDVYFAVDKFPEYGTLSGRSLEEMQAGARVDVNERKKNPLDFTLWKAAKEGEPFWESPWGKGRPGWHIECSVMSQIYLGTSFDIHGGGEDLIFPHHENEIAQSQAATGQPPAKYWLHNGFVRVNREKMSKSLGNIHSVSDILNENHPEALRLFLLQSHYRSPVDFSDSSLSEARQGLGRLYHTLGSIDDLLSHSLSPCDEPIKLEQEEILKDRLNMAIRGFGDAMNDDFNTARALGSLFDLARSVNTFLGDRSFRLGASTRELLQNVRVFMLDSGSIFGILREQSKVYFHRDRNDQAHRRGVDINEVERMIKERILARAAGNWTRADEIRSFLSRQKIVLRDTQDGTEWNFG